MDESRNLEIKDVKKRKRQRKLPFMLRIGGR
jgi:hypothetical protein